MGIVTGKVAFSSIHCMYMHAHYSVGSKLDLNYLIYFSLSLTH